MPTDPPPDPTVPPPAAPVVGGAAWAGASPAVVLPDVLAALSHALDLTEGQAPGHSARTCVIGMRFAEELGLDLASRFALYHALLLKDAGCSSNAAAMSAAFGTDDRIVKPRLKQVDWHRPVRLAVETARAVGRGRPLRQRAALLFGIARRTDLTRDLIRIRCDRGAAVARRIGFPEATAETIATLDEHWNGGGYPEGRAAEAIPLLARIANLAQTVEVAHQRADAGAALRIARQRRGSWFDPFLVDLLHRWRYDRVWWSALRTADLAAVAAIGVELGARMAASGGRSGRLDAEPLDAVASAFAEIIDAKSPYTHRHSVGVSHYAVLIAQAMGLDADTRTDLRRSGLLHDIGKLGVSNLILDKPAGLTADERRAIERHPVHSWEILSRVGGFARFARTAALHHERLDGTGYPWGLRAPALDTPARVLAVADVFEALTADRPYRRGLTPSVALDILARERGTRVCAAAVDALAGCVSSLAAAAMLPPVPDPRPAGGRGAVHPPMASSRSHPGQLPLNSKKSSK